MAQRVYHQFQSSYGKVKMMYKQIPSRFRCMAHGTLRHKYKTHSIVCIKCGIKEFTQKFAVLAKGHTEMSMSLMENITKYQIGCNTCSNG
jgi:hypothetical protein